MVKLKKYTTVQSFIDKHRGIESWIISEKGIKECRCETLVGVHRSIHDFLGDRPVFVMPIKYKLNCHRLLDNVYLLHPKIEFVNKPYMLVNELFLRCCLSYTETVTDKETGEEIERGIHFIDAMKKIYESRESLVKCMDYLHEFKQCNFVGVYGHDKIHFERGI